jgi:PIN domain nuclease of toxin-antitoxin system
MVSAASIWEIAIKVGMGKLKWSTAALSIDASIAASGFTELPVTASHAAAVRDLPPHHGDPFGRLLIAQALAEGMRIVTADGVFGRYGGRRSLPAPDVAQPIALRTRSIPTRAALRTFGQIKARRGCPCHCIG